MARTGSALRGEIGQPEKMLLDLSEEHKEHLAFLPQVDSAGEGARRRRVVLCGLGRGSVGAPGAQGLLASVAVVAEFGRIAVEFLRRGSNPKIYEGAASKKGGGTALKTARRSAFSVPVEGKGLLGL